MTQAISTAPLADKPPAPVTDISAPLNFIRRQDTKPVFLSAALTGGEQKVLFDSEAQTVRISDMREIAGTLSIDREGFELVHHATTVDDLYDDDAIAQSYYPEIETLLRDRFGANQVVIFDVTRRSDSPDGAQNPDGLRGPASRLHVDYTVKSGPQRAKDILGEEKANRLAASGARIIQINVWRLIRGPVERSPLALADASSVQQEDLIATDQLFPDRVGEIYNVAHRDAQRWYYAPQMTTDEVLLIKGWDSLDDGRARFTPHAAFPPPATRENAPARESIEVRTFVIVDREAASALPPDAGPFLLPQPFQPQLKRSNPMSNVPDNAIEHDAIAKTVEHYIEGAKSGRGDDMKPAFHNDATIFGYAGADLFAGPIQKLFDWNDENGPAAELQARIAKIDLVGTVAAVRLELNNWSGHQYTDLFTLLRVDGEWKIINKVFHLHA